MFDQEKKKSRSEFSNEETEGVILFFTSKYLYVLSNIYISLRRKSIFRL